MTEKSPEQLTLEEITPTSQLLSKINEAVIQLTRTPRQIDDEIFSFLHGYPSTLSGGECVNPFNIGQLLLYASRRMPQEILNTKPKSIRIVLTDNNENFLPENSETQTVDNKPKTAPARRRWYTTETDNEGNLTIYWHIRRTRPQFEETMGIINNNQEETNTDIVEVMAFLGVINLLRKSNYDLVVWQYLVGREGYDDFPAFQNPNSFEKWQHTPITVETDFDPKRQSAVEKFVNQISKKLDLEINKEKPFLIIGNDFSLRLMLFTLLLDGEKLNKLQQLFSEELAKFRKTLESMGLIGRKNLVSSLKKYYLLTLLNKNRDKNDGFRELYKSIFTEENYQMLGLRRILHGKNSPNEEDRSIMAEPVDFWDPANFSQELAELLEEKKDYLAELVKRLLKRNKPILFMPYLLGTLSAQVVQELLSKGLIDPKAFGFFGKVGYWDSGKERDPLKRGQLVLPQEVYHISGSNAGVYPHGSFLSPEQHSHIINFARSAPFMTTPSVLTQSPGDLEKYPFNVCLESEQYYILSNLNNGDKRPRIIGSFYVSDISRSGSSEDTIIKPLTPEEGVIGVCLSILLILEQLSLST